MFVIRLNPLSRGVHIGSPSAFNNMASQAAAAPSHVADTTELLILY